MMPSIKMRQDYGLFLKILRIAEQNGFRALGLKQCLARYRVHPNSMTYNKIISAYYQWRLYRDIEKLTLTKSLVAMVSYLLEGIRDRV